MDCYKYNEAMKNYHQEFLKLLDKTVRLCHYSTQDLFKLFLKLSSIAIQNSVNYSQEREDIYLSSIKGLDKQTLQNICELLAILVKALESQRHDFLGPIYTEIKGCDSKFGQFLTPDSVSKLMGELVFHEKLKNQEFITVYEPSCGSGSTIINFIDTVFSYGINAQKKVFVVCEDIDINMCYMAYLQLSFLGMGAIIQHKDTLSNELFCTMYTPMFFMEGWKYKLSRKDKKDEKVDNIVIDPLTGIKMIKGGRFGNVL